MQAPEVSVVVPLYNKVLYVRRTLESVFAQTFTRFEAIVVDDGSTDGSGGVVMAMNDPRLRLIRQENCGVGAARNRGIREARGDLIAFLDADDRWEPGFLEAVIALSKAYPQAGWFVTGYRRCMGTGWDREVAIRPVGARQTGLVDNYLSVARQGDVVTSSSVALRRKTLDQTGWFAEKQPLGEDQDLWVRTGVRYPLGFDTRILAVYHSEATGRACNLAAKPVLLPAINSLRHLLGEGTLSAHSRNRIRSYLDWYQLTYVAGMLYGGNRETIGSFLRAACFATVGFRVRAALLKVGLRILPAKLLAAIRLKPVAALWRLRRTPVLRHVLSAGEALLGRAVVFRLVPAEESE